MFQVLFCYWLVFVTLSSHSTTAADVDIYPGKYYSSLLATFKLFYIDISLFYYLPKVELRTMLLSREWFSKRCYLGGVFVSFKLVIIIL